MGHVSTQQYTQYIYSVAYHQKRISPVYHASKSKLVPKSSDYCWPAAYSNDRTAAHDGPTDGRSSGTL